MTSDDKPKGITETIAGLGLWRLSSPHTAFTPSRVDRDKPKSGAAQDAAREHEMLLVMQAAAAPLPPRKIAQRLGTAPKTVSSGLAAARRRGFVGAARSSLLPARSSPLPAPRLVGHAASS